MTTHRELTTAFAMWRKVYQETTRLYILGYYTTEQMAERMLCMGFTDAEAQAEIDIINGDTIPQTSPAMPASDPIAPAGPLTEATRGTPTAEPTPRIFRAGDKRPEFGFQVGDEFHRNDGLVLKWDASGDWVPYRNTSQEAD